MKKQSQIKDEIIQLYELYNKMKDWQDKRWKWVEDWRDGGSYSKHTQPVEISKETMVQIVVAREQFYNALMKYTDSKKASLELEHDLFQFMRRKGYLMDNFFINLVEEWKEFYERESNRRFFKERGY